MAPEKLGIVNITGRCGLILASAVAASLVSGPAAAQNAVKFTLDWKFEGPAAPFLVPIDKGYYKAEGLDVTIDTAGGSLEPLNRVASGTYDIGFGDINALIEFAARKPEEAPVAVYMMYNRPPFTVAVKTESPIRTPKDFEGRTLGGAPNDGALKLFPALAKLAKFDESKVAITNMAPNLREQMLMRGQVDGVFGYVNTIRFSAKLMGVDPDKQLRWVNYGDYGMDLYSNAIIVSRKLIKENPAAVRGFLRAMNKALVDSLKDPKASVAAVVKREPLIRTDVELERFDATIKEEMNHPEIAQIGLGEVDDARLRKAIEIMVEANQLPRTPALSEIFNREFLPPKSERPTKLVDAKS
jgi:NitT/TauT family transport system substrate-binding protein